MESNTLTGSESMQRPIALTHASLFSGIGGWELAAQWAGYYNLFHCEIAPFPRQILTKHYPNSVSYRDVSTVDFTTWKGIVNVLSSSFPCQPFSCAGKRRGVQDSRYLWPATARVIRECQPDWIVAENVTGIISMEQPPREIKLEEKAHPLFPNNYLRAVRTDFVLHQILDEIGELGYAVQAFAIPAAALGAPHRRNRVWIVAHATGERQQQPLPAEQEFPATHGELRAACQPQPPSAAQFPRATGPDCPWDREPGEPPILAADDGLPPGLLGLTPKQTWAERVKAVGNAICPQIAYEILTAIRATYNDNA